MVLLTWPQMPFFSHVFILGTWMLVVLRCLLTALPASWEAWTGLSIVGEITQRLNLFAMPKSHRRTQGWVRAGGATLGTHQPQPALAAQLPLSREGWRGCWGTWGNSQEKVKAFSVSSAGAWGVRVWNTTWKAESDQVSRWRFVLIRAIRYKSWQTSQPELKAPTHPVWVDLQVAVCVFGGNSRVIS